MPARPYDYIRVVHRGHMDSNQTFSFGLSLLPSAPGAISSQLNSLATAVSAAFNTGPLGSGAAIRSCLGGPGVWNGVTLYYYVAGGNTASLGAAVDYATPVTALGGSTGPNDAAIVCSLRTTTPGRTGRGRAYLPGNGCTFSAHQLSTPTPSAIASNLVSYIQALNLLTYNSGTIAVVVASTRNPPPIVSRVVVDSKVDTQRRRENKIGAATTVSSVV